MQTRRAAVAFLCLATFCIPACSETPAPLLGDPIIKISGPPGQLLSVAHTQFMIEGENERATTTRGTVYLSDEGYWERVLENGFNGLVVESVVPTDEPVTIELWLDGKQHKTLDSKNPSRVRIEAGRVPNAEEIAYEIRPNEDEQKLVQSLIDGLNGGSIGELISQDKASVDAVLLTEMMKVAKSRFGDIESLHQPRWSKANADDHQFDMYRADIEFEDGIVLGFTFFTDEGKLVAVRERNDEFAADWWQEAALGDTYVGLGKNALTDLLEKRYEGFYSKLGEKVRDSMSVEDIKSYRDQLPSIPESGIKEISLTDHKFLEIDSEFERRAQLIFDVEFEDASANCRAKVNYNFATGSGWKTGEIIGVRLEPN